MTYSIIARGPDTGQMGVACQSQAFAVGSSVPWASPGHGVVATQSMGEPMYGELGLDGLRAGLTAAEALTALRAVDPHPERRQVAMVDSYANIAAYTGEACVPAAGHVVGEGCAALANMVAADTVWDAMVEAYQAASGSVATRLLTALHAAEDAGGDFRGRRSASILVVRAQRTGRPWRDQLVDLRVDDDPDPLWRLDHLVAYSDRYHHLVQAFELAVDGYPHEGLAMVDAITAPDPATEPELCLWHAVILALAGATGQARGLIAELEGTAPQFVEAARRFRSVGLVGDDPVLDDVLAPPSG